MSLMDVTPGRVTANRVFQAEPAGAQPSAMSSMDLAFIADLVKARSGIVLGSDKVYLVEARLEQVVRKSKLANLRELVVRLRTQPADRLIHDVVDAMTTNESLFFRDGKPFEHLRNHVLSRLLEESPPSRPIRIWSAAASSGQECYSIAMIVAEAQLAGRRVEIIGTDISAEQIAKAREGLYTQFEVQRGLPIRNLMQYFEKDGERWRVKETIRRLVEFREWNLLSDLRPLGSFDVVFCRNVLIYFDTMTRRKVLDTIWERMEPGGVLYLGGAETTLGVSERFASCEDARQTYRPIGR